MLLVCLISGGDTTDRYNSLGLGGNRPWNVSSMDMFRPPFESYPNPTRRKYLQRSLTSSELMGPSYRRCLPAIPLPKSQKNSLYGSSKSVHSYDCVQPKTDPPAVLPKDDKVSHIFHRITFFHVSN